MRGLALIVLPIALALSGCEQIPIPRANAAPIHIPPPTAASTSTSGGKTPVTTVVVDERQLLPPLPSQLREAPEPSNPLPPTAPLEEAMAPTGLVERVTRTVDASEAPALPPDKQPPPLPMLEEPATTPSEEPADPPPGPSSDAKGEPATQVLKALVAVETGTQAKPVSIDAEKVVKAADPEELWTEGIARLRKLAAERGKSSDSSPVAWELRSRLLELIDQADRQHDQGETPLWKPVLNALAGMERSSSIDAQTRAAEIRAAVSALENEAPLEIGELKLCRKVRGFGSYEAMDSNECHAGQPLIVYCEMSGVRYLAAGEVSHSRLSAHVELVRSRGGESAWSQDLGTAEDVCRHRRRDYYVNYRVVLPDSLPAGDYILRVTQNDELAGHAASATIPLTLAR